MKILLTLIPIGLAIVISNWLLSRTKQRQYVCLGSLQSGKEIYFCFGLL